jgi:hypothetical protein
LNDIERTLRDERFELADCVSGSDVLSMIAELRTLRKPAAVPGE